MMTQLRGWRFLLLVLGLLVAAWMLIDFNGRMARMNHLKLVREDTVARYAEVQGTLTALQTESAFAASDAAVEKWAYEQGHMVRPGDQPIIPVSSGQAAATPAPKPAATPTPLSNQDSWKALFFAQTLP
jgi:hypothetical protein